MPVESATYISQLDPTAPAGPEGVAQGDDHLRLLKSTLKTTFPNVTGAITATHTQLNSAGSAFSGNSVFVPASGAFGGAVFLRGSAGNQDIVLSNAGPGRFSLDRRNPDNSGVTQLLSVDAGGLFNVAGRIMQGGADLVPRGIITMWAGSVGSVPAGWAICNGANGTPNLLDRFVVAAGASYGVGAAGGSGVGSGTTSTAGFHSHGGATAAGGDHAHNGYTDGQGAHNHGGATQDHVLQISEMPQHTHGYINVGGGAGIQPGSGLGNVGGQTDPVGNNAGHSHGISVDGNHAHNIQTYNSGNHVHGVTGDGNHQHTVTVGTIPPYFALCYIMKT